MRKFWKDMTASVFMGAVLPAIVFSHGAWLMPGTPAAEPVSVSVPVETVCAEERKTIGINLLQTDGTVAQAELEQYLVGVVLAEMPAYFEGEALKAQAVVARTYTVKTVASGAKHGESTICTDSQCCQAYISVMDYLERGGTGQSVEKVRDAVSATAGKVLVYEDKLIEATYFSCSGGITEDAQAVWGTDYPYLKSVVSPGEEGASVYTDTAFFTFQQFQNCLGTSLSGNPSEWIGAVTYTPGNGVDRMMIGGREYTGTQLRSLLGLRSTNLSVELTEDGLEIYTKGYGHRVGMSQYGADAMAVNGSNYAEILAHYYPGTELTDVKDVLQKDT
jgi:stage II sporulation protein D